MGREHVYLVIVCISYVNHAVVNSLCDDIFSVGW